MDFRCGALFGCLVLAGTLAAAAAQPNQDPHGKINGRGTAAALTDANNVPLYFYDRDTRGKSTCYDACAATWPPLPAPPHAAPTGKWSVVTRRDGSKQWAYDGKPVYEYKNDTKPGSRGAVPISTHWHVARP